MKTPFISIIVPVYNRETLVSNAIKSILAQTYKNFELLLIDDGSTDNSYGICKQYMDIDARISLFTQKNSGVGVARNLGIENSKGDYICFVDSDDSIENDLLQCYVNEIENKDYDLVICGFRNHLQNGKTKFFELPEKEIFTIEEFWENFGNLLDANLLRSPVNKLYKKEIIQKYNISFDSETQIAEDAIFNAWYYEYIESVRIIKKPLYNVRLHEGDFGLSNSFHESFFSAQAKLFPKYISLLKKKNCFVDNNFNVVSRQYSALIWKGLCTSYNALNTINIFLAKENLLYEIFPVKKEIHCFYHNFGKAVIKDDINYLKIVCILRSASKRDFAIDEFLKTKKVIKKMYALARIIFWQLFFFLEYPIKTNKINKCRVYTARTTGGGYDCLVLPSSYVREGLCGFSPLRRAA